MNVINFTQYKEEKSYTDLREMIEFLLKNYNIPVAQETVDYVIKLASYKCYKKEINQEYEMFLKDYKFASIVTTLLDEKWFY